MSNMPVNLHSMATDHAEASAALDPLLCDFPLPLSCVVYPMGYPLEIMTNSAEVVLAAEEAWGHYPCLRKTAPVKIRLVVAHPGEVSSTGTPTFRAHGHIVFCSIGRDDYLI